MDGKTRVAQYGQWDGYPGGQGLTVLKFLKTANMDEFKKRLDGVKFLRQEDIDAFCKSEGFPADGWLNEAQAKIFRAKFPGVNRDLGAEILQKIYDGSITEIKNSEGFAGDSLFCEWAYVIDLDSGMLEVYKGFNTSPLPETDRFAKMEKDGKYYPVRLVKSYPISALPEKDVFVAECNHLELEE